MSNEEALQELRTFKAMNVKVLELKPDDVLVLDFSEYTKDNLHEAMMSAGPFMKRLFPHRTTMILGFGIQLAVVKDSCEDGDKSDTVELECSKCGGTKTGNRNSKTGPCVGSLCPHCFAGMFVEVAE